MTQVLGTFRIGEDIVIALDAVAGDVADVATITAAILPGRPGLAGSVFQPKPNSPPIPMTVTARAAEGDFPSGWNLTLQAAASAQLVPGLYAIDAKLTAATGSIDITDVSAVIIVNQAAVS